MNRAVSAVETVDPDQAWMIRAWIYDYIVETGRPPSVAETAMGAGITTGNAAATYAWLDAHHALVLDDDRVTIRIANPFSGVPTGFQVHATGRTYWANCAWDAVGIPAALQADATIEATLSDDDSQVQIVVKGGSLLKCQELVHFPLPFAAWYDDLVHT